MKPIQKLCGRSLQVLPDSTTKLVIIQLRGYKPHFTMRSDSYHWYQELTTFQTLKVPYYYQDQNIPLLFGRTLLHHYCLPDGLNP